MSQDDLILKNEKLIGCLLGDASIDKYYGGQNSRFIISQSPKYYDLIYDMRDELDKLGLSSTLIERKNVGYAKNTIIQLQSGRKKVFTELRKKWYPDGKKRIPDDLQLTNKIIAYLFMCDGSTKWDHGRVNLGLATDGFLKVDVELLQSKLLEKNYKFYITTDYIHNTKRLNMAKSLHVIDILKNIQPYVLPCFQYKLKFPRETSWRHASFRRNRINGRFAS